MPSSERSSTTIQRAGGSSWAATARTTRSMCAASLRTGEMMRMRGCTRTDTTSRTRRALPRAHAAAASGPRPRRRRTRGARARASAAPRCAWRRRRRPRRGGRAARAPRRARSSRGRACRGSSRMSRAQRAQVAAEPARERHREALLRAGRGSSSGSQPRSASRRIHFFSRAADLQLGGNRRGELHQLVVEERRAGLERVGHRRDVDLRDQVVGEVGRDVDLEHPSTPTAPDAARPGGGDHVARAGRRPASPRTRACRARRAAPASNHDT